MGKIESIWEKNRPKINKELFVEKMRDNDFIHKLEVSQITQKILQQNEKIRGLFRNKRSIKHVSDSVHNHAETMNFYLGYDKNLKWIEVLE